VTVLRLTGTANDLAMLFRLLDLLREHEQDSLWAKSVGHGARRFVFRMGTLHLTDLRQLVNHSDFKRAVDRLSARVPEITEAAEELRRCLNRSPLSTLVAHVRNEFAAHPSREAVEHALGIAVEEGLLMEVPTDWVGRLGLHFNVTDRLFDARLVEMSHESYSRAPRYKSEDAEDSVRLVLEEMLDATVALMNLGQKMVIAMYLDTPRR
jgi:hypothetical protein